ncbi:MAG: phosphogluconate dehydrogenase (NAD(+)-dependent, decarboxylating) [Candidatus Micrarchaeaceae archaeon]
MEIGLVGLGKMGKGLAMNMMRNGYKIIVQNRSPGPVEEAVANGARKAESIPALVGMLKPKRLVWLMLTAGEPTESAIRELSGLLSKGDIIIDGSNSQYRDSVRMHELLKEKGIYLVDAGCSGGPSGALNGLCIMAGGDPEAIKHVEPLLRELSIEKGYLYTGKIGSGHFVKMVHNAIEYGMMQSIAEGLELIEEGPYSGADLAAICDLWNNGSVIRGYLIELAARSFRKDQHLSEIEPYVDDMGEGRWSVQTAVDYAVPFTTISNSLFERFRSRSKRRFGNRVLAALRHEFGGHEVKKAGVQ